MTRRRAPTLARQLFALQLVLLTVVVLAGAGLALLDARRDNENAASQEVLGVAETLARAGSTVTALASADPSATLQTEAELIRVATGTDFVVVMAPDRTRFSHPDPTRLGEPFQGTIAPALAGTSFTETYTGTLGPSVRAVVPVTSDGAVVGLVAVGITQAALGRELVAQLPELTVVVVIALTVAAAGSLLLSRRLRRQTLGLAPTELASMFQHQDAVLHAVREGLVVRDAAGSVTLVNDEARRLLGLGAGPVHAGDLPASLRGPDGRATDELHLTGDRVLVVNREPTVFDGRELGSVLTLRDHTELQGVLGELDSVRGFAESLRSQAHESANRLHSIITMVELGRGEEAVELATAELELSQHLIDRLLAAVDEPALAALLLGKVARAAEVGIELTVSADTAVPAETGLPTRDLLTVVGNLLDNACEAALGPSPWVEVSVRAEHQELVVSVADSGTGLDPAALTAALRRGHSTKSSSRGLGLALVAQVVARHDGRVAAGNDDGSAVTVTLPMTGAAR